MKIACIDPITQLFAIELGQGYGYREVGYLMVIEGRTVLIDLADHRILPLIQKFHVPEILILTHRHTHKDEAFFERVFGTKIYLSHEDATSLAAQAATKKAQGLNTIDSQPLAKSYLDPQTCPDLAQLGFSFMKVEGHTAGSVFVFNRAHGLFFSGDSLVGAKEDSSDPATHPLIELPPPQTCESIDLLRKSLKQLILQDNFNGIKRFLPLHGKPAHFMQNINIPSAFPTALISSLA